MRKQTLLKILEYVKGALNTHPHNFELQEAKKDLEYLIELEP